MGRKKKGIHVDSDGHAATGEEHRKITKGHKRSRTVGNGEVHAPSSASAAQPSGKSRSTTSAVDLVDGRGRMLLPGQRIDNTRTDYFRLKVRGIDPDTPSVPDTKASLERKRRLVDEEELFRPRASTFSSSLRTSKSEPLAMLASNGVPDPGHPSPTGDACPGLGSPAKLPPKPDDDDEFLRQIRKMRSQIDQDTEWFKSQTAQLEMEIEQQVEYRRSASQPSILHTPHVSENGLARASGYDYLPARSRPGQGLSRTEQRIRRTGAHGLATKPIGGTRDYLAVPMSKQSAAKFRQQSASPEYHGEAVAEKKRKYKGKRKRVERDTTYRPGQEDEDSEELEDEAVARHRALKPRLNGIKKPEPTFAPAHHCPDLEGGYEEEYGEEAEEGGGDGQHPRYPDLVQYQSMENEADDSVDEDGGDGQYPLYPDLVQYQSMENEADDPADKDYVAGDEGGEEDVEDEEIEDGEEDEEDAVAALPKLEPGANDGRFWLRSSATPERALGDRLTPAATATQMSRATSGTGASVDDAFVLSD